MAALRSGRLFLARFLKNSVNQRTTIHNVTLEKLNLKMRIFSLGENMNCVYQALTRTEIRQYVQKWIHTPLQNYQMYEFIQKWVFHWIFIRIRIATSVTFGRKWKNLIPQNNYKKCHVLH